jgi:hypothetical protein
MSMERCAVRRGFFVLRGCDHPAVATCAACARPVCAEHAVAGNGAVRCVECQARFTEPSGEPFWRSRASAFAYRERYYSSHTPIHWGTSDTVYSDSDFQPFDGDPAVPDHDVEDAGGGFYES